MNPFLALIICLAFIIWLFHRDRRAGEAGPAFLIIPFFWISILSSRPLSSWFGLNEATDGPLRALDGSPMDRAIYLALILLAAAALWRRNIDLKSWISANKPLFSLYVWYLCSTFWSDYPFVSLKRLVKDFGCVLIAVGIRTSPQPNKLLSTLYVRASFILLPLSVILIKYYPSYGRNFSKSGELMYTGVTTQKNTLGEVVLVLGIVLIWDLWVLGGKPEVRRGTRERLPRYLVSLIGLWLLYTADSMTAALCLGIAVSLIAMSKRFTWAWKPRATVAWLSSMIVISVGLNSTLGITDRVATFLGRDPTLTGRTGIWEQLAQQPTSPTTGWGFYIFWDTQTALNLYRDFTEVKSAHNGYLEAYLDGGVPAVLLLSITLLAFGRNVAEQLAAKQSAGSIAFATYVTALVYNLSESSFFRLSPLWQLLLVLALRDPKNTRPYDTGVLRHPRE